LKFFACLLACAFLHLIYSKGLIHTISQMSTT